MKTLKYSFKIRTVKVFLFDNQSFNKFYLILNLISIILKIISDEWGRIIAFTRLL